MLRLLLPRSSALLLGLLLALPAGARPDRAGRLREEFQARRRKVLVEAAQEHLTVGAWARKAGLVAQSTAEFLRAVEVAEGQHPGALRLLAIMRNLDDRFWIRKLDDPSDGMLRAYEKRARKARRFYEKSRLDLAEWAARKDELAEEAYAEYRALVGSLGVELEVDGRGRIELEFGTVPEGVSARLLAEAVTINERRYVRDDFLAHLPDVGEIHEAENPSLRVRTTSSAERTASILAGATALLPLVAQDAGGTVTRRLDLFVFPTRATYEAWLEAAGLGDHKVGTGLADGARHVALVCGEGLDDEAVLGVAFHELAHLVQYEIVPVVMPSWYSEGFAETWGGVGTYVWDGEDLQAGGEMASYRLEPLKTDGGFLPLSELVAGDALELLTTDPDRGHRFYAESWALRRFLRTGADEDVRERFHQWELTCKGAALGAEPGKPYARNTQPAAALFQQTFGEEMAAIEAAFRTWLAAS